MGEEETICDMSDGVETLSIEEVARLLSRLRQTDHLRLAALAQAWISGCPRREATELLNEALARVLSGARPWPADVALPAFLSQVMRSIASQWRHEDQREPLLEDADVVRDESVITVNHDFTDLRERMRKALADDRDALGIFEHILAQTSRKDVRAELGTDETQYDTARRRMIRTLHEQFNPGWTL
ncbi:hypothetical protein ASE90_05355 [Sphingomonas sp. Leaf67]|uniref:hypothetical protein n=1 Tax=Sphingomonas sp. Leaf67 TaxID=1736230 RepID=UPI0006F883AC|nr:hypothetical protein [Sphingomonas sp. Leaf67]KQN92156.1 hypothetical protein ASE90_05355 [Sphingomonas sp. Leaf67]